MQEYVLQLQNLGSDQANRSLTLRRTPQVPKAAQTIIGVFCAKMM